MIKSKEDLLASLKDRLGEDTSDEAIALIEDVNDTFGDYETRISGSGDWKQKYEDNDKMWRQKYRDRFMSPTAPDDDPEPDPEPAIKTFEDLFKRGE